MSQTNDLASVAVGICIALLAIAAAYYFYITSGESNFSESFDNPVLAGTNKPFTPMQAPDAIGINEESGIAETNETEPAASEPVGANENFKPLPHDDQNLNKSPNDCYPKKQLTAEDLLPAECDNTWAQSNPVVPGSLNTQNFLDAGHHIGLNTVGQSLRNPNMQMRSEPPNPQLKVCPWNQSTIEPDVGRKGLEIGTGC